MAILVEADKARALLAAVKAEIDAGNVTTWEYDSDGDFTHSPPQWRHKAWLRPVIEPGKIIFKILTPKGQKMSRAVYAVYHGRFAEMLLTHFDVRFDQIIATALPSHGDVL
jgi:hypothetical protein